MNKWRKKIVWILAMLITMSTVQTAGAADTMTAKAMNMKQSDNSITGISTPTSTEEDATEWTGDYIYFGKYKGNPIKFRVLNPRESHFGDTTLLLDSDAILEQRAYRTPKVTDVGTKWSDAPLRTWCNGTGADQFLSGFTTEEQNAIVASTKASNVGTGEFPSEKYKYTAISGDKVFVLDASEANYSGYGYANDDTRIKQGGIGEWWLRSTNPEVNDAVCTVYNDGNIYNYYFGNYAKVGVSPALNVDLDAVLFTSAYGMEKLNTFSKVGDSSTNEWKLTVKATDADLTATTADTSTFYVDKADTDNRSLSITHLAANTVLSTANQTSAVLTDAVGNVMYYGKVSDASSTSSTVEIADDLAIGTYSLYVFAEDVNSAVETDYASALGTPIAITVQSTETVSKYAVTVVNGFGSGKYEKGAVVEIRANMAEEGKQFKEWQVTSGTVTLADKTNPTTTFEMPDKKVTVTAVYEDISETSNTGDYIRMISIGLFAVAMVCGCTLLVIKKRMLKKAD